jgi:hypothetical protein
MPSSSTVDAALVAKLLASAPLMAIATDGVYWGVGKEDGTRFVVVDLLDHTDEAVLGGRAIESSLYLVKFVRRMDTASGYSNIEAAQAADYIDQTLEDQPFAAAGYNWMTCYREARVRYPEVDPDDPSVRWMHWGGHYRVEVSVVGA